TLNCGNIIVGNSFNTAGTINVNDDDADLISSGTLTVAFDTNLLCSLNITGGGLVEADAVVLGDQNPAGEGRVTVSGFTVAPISASTLRTTIGDVVVGDLGIGTLDVAAGGRVDVGRDMFIARDRLINQQGSVGSVTVGGTGLAASRIDVADDLFIGRD